MNTNTIIIALLALVLGLGVGYTAAPQKTVPLAGNHMMSDDTAMGDAMSDMMSGLSGKTGDEFDKAFLREMIVHHQGAVEMARAALTNAKHQEIKTMANAIISAQTAEIQQMQNWGKSWYGQ